MSVIVKGVKFLLGNKGQGLLCFYTELAFKQNIQYG